MTQITIHGSAVLISEGALLIRGAPGAGKSTLVLQLLNKAHESALYNARLVADDQVYVERHGDSLVVLSPPPLEGLIEQRQLGLLHVAYEQRAVLKAVLDIDERAERLPEAELKTAILDCMLPCFKIKPHSPFGLIDVLRLMQNIS